MVRVDFRSINASPTSHIPAILVGEADLPEAGTVVLAAVQSFESGVALG